VTPGRATPSATGPVCTRTPAATALSSRLSRSPPSSRIRSVTFALRLTAAAPPRPARSARTCAVCSWVPPRTRTRRRESGPSGDGGVEGRWKGTPVGAVDFATPGRTSPRRPSNPGLVQYQGPFCSCPCGLVTHRPGVVAHDHAGQPADRGRHVQALGDQPGDELLAGQPGLTSDDDLHALHERGAGAQPSGAVPTTGSLDDPGRVRRALWVAVGEDQRER